MELFRQVSQENHQDSESHPQDNHSLKNYKLKHVETQPDQSGSGVQDLYESEPQSKKLRIRLAVFSLCVLLLIIGRYNIPSEVTYVCIDRLQDVFLGVNEFINKEENAFWRNAMQIICSLFMDVMFLATGINWIIRGGGSRLVFTTVSFYLLRAVVQAIWVSPMPEKGYWWYDPGFPSLVVPYGLGTDFFFSGHIGFVTICASEWRKNGNKLMANLLAIGGVYTGFILLAYRVHYSIDLFTGVTFAHWLFMLVDQNKEKIDNIFIDIYYFGKKAYTAYKGPQEVEQKLYNNM